MTRYEDLPEGQGQAIVPAVDERGCAPDFNIYENKLWDASDKNAVPPRNRVLIANALNDNVVLRVRLDGRESVEETANREAARANERGSAADVVARKGYGIVLRAFAETDRSPRREIASTNYIPSAAVSPQLRYTFEFSNLNLKQMVSPYRARGEPWAFVGRISFELIILSPSYDQTFLILDSGAMYPIELYAICPAMPNFLKFEGIPINLLRFALGPQNKRAGNDGDTPYLTAITNRVFNSGFRYERNGGWYAYTSGAGSTFEVNKFLKIWNVVNGTASEETKALYNLRFKRQPPTVNCYDQTGILGLCLYFACKDDQDLATLTPYYMEPFGFLHRTPLVGWDKDEHGNIVYCNNPFIGKTDKLEVNPMAPERSKFRNHVFLAFRNLVYDACAGPFIGHGDLKEYVKLSIDSAPHSHPTTFYNGDDLVTPPESEYTGTADNAYRHKVSNKHGGILGELDSMMREREMQLSTEVSAKLDSDNFKLDALNVVPYLQTKATNNKQLTVNRIVGPFGESGALDIKSDPTEQGEYTWLIESSSWSDQKNSWVTGTVLLYWRIFPDFKTAIKERAGMYGNGHMSNGPTDAELATDEIVRAWFKGTDIVTATAVIQRHMLHVESFDITRAAAVQLIQDVLKCATYEYQPSTTMKVSGQESPSKGSGIDAEGTVKLEARVNKVTTFIVEVQNCFDIDWSYSKGKMFLIDYDVSDKKNFTLGPGEQITKEPGDDKRFADAGPTTATKVYRFKFYAREYGADAIRLVFYNRYYKATVRNLEFNIHWDL
ncbi:hypothetical protein Dda_3256 [Drechslerella dactyloides]|uniref:Uncharacterized protein n=1 Tax=Drechslerella dactyloides TaxID=74499 RepID=A0AAD6NMN9_DREDA|nr:hypothetical protein Dda_3256 [Drechslerella dactyloides]